MTATHAAGKSRLSKGALMNLPTQNGGYTEVLFLHFDKQYPHVITPWPTVNWNMVAADVQDTISADWAAQGYTLETKYTHEPSP